LDHGQRHGKNKNYVLANLPKYAIISLDLTQKGVKMIEKDPKMPENNSTKILEEQRKKLVEPTASQLEVLWRGYIKGTFARVCRFQQDEKTPPEILVQTWTFSEWQNCTNPQQFTIIVESYRMLQKLVSKDIAIIEEMEEIVSPNDNVKSLALDSRMKNFTLPTEEEMEKTLSSKPKRGYGHAKPEDGTCGA
jgi:hypothetical protein